MKIFLSSIAQPMDTWTVYRLTGESPAGLAKQSPRLRRAHIAKNRAVD